MTLVTAFVRNLENRRARRELVIASDSRLSWGQRLDSGAKIFALPRSDALLAFAGDTAYAYPLVQQLIGAIAVYARNVDRRFPLPKLRHHMLRVFNQLYESIYGFPVGADKPLEDEPPVQFLFAGYVWQEKTFRVWRVVLDRRNSTFKYLRCRAFTFIGDPAAVAEAKRTTGELLRARGRTTATMDMEPFEALRDIIRAQRHPHVGGAPQIAKVYEHMNSQFFGTLWQSGDSTAVHVFGPLLHNETISWPVFEPDLLRFEDSAAAADAFDEALADSDDGALSDDEDIDEETPA